ncbi:hypothetical protein [Pseudobacteriovorax antillogorgiicola]|uniref:Chemotaxis phosphatase CheX n=1 Tax=Pseudobacteriovorax antillogorgiicola TaxID=1513793 RepID=A0A1Y6CL93_9BACT|nr:hypothetical protein [Pseudobacteriovorax antillogorgiicola]TCS47914.1 hypothetical protein EDD56_11925 [Pseudobacteriovorax antillogorgiicola]SMF57868.1 hypothetical protein SAMN06296036_11926 [Pseudobacteriovorax antillogorgiicola]
MTEAKKLYDGNDISMLKGALRDAASNRLKSVIPAAGFQAIEMESHPALSEDDWMVKIIVESEDLIFTFRVYYQVDDAKAFASQKASFKGKNISPFLCHDFIREYCNLTAGALKIWLQSNYSALKESGELVVNLPNQKPALSEPLAFKEDEEEEIYDFWIFTLDNAQILCSWDVEIHDWAGVTEMLKSTSSLAEQDDGGDVDFL